MKVMVYCLSMILIFSSCNNDDIGNVYCFNGFDEVVFSQTDQDIDIETPTLIINDAPDYGLYAIRFLDENSNKFLPDSIKFEVFDLDENLIFKNHEVTGTDSLHKVTYLWDGLIDNIPYNGIVSFKLSVQVNSELKMNASGRVQVVSCNDLKECGTETSICNIADCRFYGHMIEYNPYMPNSCF